MLGKNCHTTRDVNGRRQASIIPNVHVRRTPNGNTECRTWVTAVRRPFAHSKVVDGGSTPGRGRDCPYYGMRR
jgi:hypothetical protein